MNKRELILLVEDDDTDAFIAKTLLLRQYPNLKIERLNHGLEAQRFLDELEDLPALIILDLNMPFLNGREFLKELREREEGKQCEVVVLSSSENKDDLSQCNEMGVENYFIKPLTIDMANKIITLAGFTPV
jgi:CheY-like chemotaxis protein